MDDARFYKNRVILAGLLGLLLAGCATVNVPNAGQDGYKVEDDERRMYKRAEEYCELLDQGDLLYGNAGLDEYLTRLAEKFVPEQAKQDGVTVSVKVVNDPDLNAFAFPNGRLYVHVGILASAENEAQLAALLGHELTHVVNRHQLKSFRSLQNKTAFFRVLGDMVGVAVGSLGSMVTQLAGLSSISGYAQNLEYEADEGGYKLLVENKYDPREAPKLFEKLDSYISMEEVKQPFFFSSHPSVKARINKFNELLAQNQFQAEGEWVVDTEDFRGFRVPVLFDQVRLCLKEGLFKTADKTLEQLAKVAPDDKNVYYFYGELYRQRQDHEKNVKTRDKSGDYAQAVGFYDKALSLDASYAAAVKGKARVFERQKETEKAKESFKQYLQLNPGADDRAYIEQYLTVN